MKIVKTPGYNYVFNDKTGFFARWGKTVNDDPQYSPISTEIVDISISSICHTGCSFCFVPSTMIQIPDGLKSIQDLEVGDIVLSNQDGMIIENTITSTNSRIIEEDIVEIVLDDNSVVRVTKNHEFYVGGTWIEAQYLCEGDELASYGRKICKDCGGFVEDGRIGFVCRKCKNARARARYYTRLFEKFCKYCGQSFLGQRQKYLCQDCEDKRIIDRSNEYVKDIICYRCKEVIDHKILVVPFELDKSLESTSLCEKCHSEYIETIRKRMLSDENPAIKKSGRRKVKKKKSKEEFSKETSERMRLNNPMKRDDVRKKVSKKIKELVQTGELVYKRGSDHGNWKGNRDGAQTIRTRLYVPWIYPILESYGFKCSVCGCRGRLEVHHQSESFRDIVSLLLGERVLDDLTEKELDSFIEKVIAYHLEKPVIGIPYCVEHHKEVDSKRR